VAVLPSFDAAIACYQSPDYQAVLALARDADERDLGIVDGN